MTREKRLSPRRASSRLPLSPRQTQVRLKPLLFLRPLPLQRRHTKKARLARFCTHYEYPFFDARPEGFRSSVRLRGMSSRPTARLRRKSTVCGLNGLRPSFAGSPPFKSSTPGRAGLLRQSLFCAVLKRQLAFPFWKEKLRLAYFFSPKRNPKDSLERRGKQRPMAQPKR
jgi:hypothetical protein